MKTVNISPPPPLDGALSSYFWSDAREEWLVLSLDSEGYTCFMRWDNLKWVQHEELIVGLSSEREMLLEKIKSLENQVRNLESLPRQIEARKHQQRLYKEAINRLSSAGKP